jgi:RimJ/RimL family protein N-acetyltransferase
VRLAPALELRAAREQDAQLLLEWRNDPETRRSSREQREIQPEEHASWLRGILAGDPTPPQEGSTLLWIAECEGRPVASVRVGPRMGMAAEVHLAVAPEERGRGVGAGALVQASARALADPGLELLRAHVKPGNEASLRAFARAGFARDGAAMDGLVRLERPKLRERPTAGAGHMR